MIEVNIRFTEGKNGIVTMQVNKPASMATVNEAEYYKHFIDALNKLPVKQKLQQMPTKADPTKN